MDMNAYFSGSYDMLASFLELGGPVVVILFVTSIVAAALVGLKLVQFSMLRVGRTGRAAKAVALFKAGETDEAETLARAGRSASASAVATAIRLSRRGDLAKSDIEEEIGRIALVRLHSLEGGFRFLDICVQLAPLLGLFGTVLGMIDAFQKLQGAGSSVDPSILAGGIWVALLTTAAGLAVAMPVSLVLTYLEARVEKERVAIETMASEILSPALRPPRDPRQQAPLRPVELRHAT
jgi:biopolymer transport protein ExbB